MVIMPTAQKMLGWISLVVDPTKALVSTPLKDGKRL